MGLKIAPKFFLILILFGLSQSGFSEEKTFEKESLEEELPKISEEESSLNSSSKKNILKNLSAADFYNQGIDFYRSGDEIKALASFRKSLYLDPWAWSSWKALNYLERPASLWWLIPFELFLFFMALSVFFLIFSIRKWKTIFFSFCLLSNAVFFYYRKTPRVTVTKDTFSRTAPSLSSSEAFALEAGDWVTLLKTQGEWAQIGKQKAAGWLLKSEVL